MLEKYFADEGGSHTQTVKYANLDTPLNMRSLHVVILLGTTGAAKNIFFPSCFIANGLSERRTSVRRPSDVRRDVRRTSDGRPTDVRQTSIGHPSDVRRTSDGRTADVPQKSVERPSDGR